MVAEADRIYGHPFAQDRASLLAALNQTVGRLCAYRTTTILARKRPPEHPQPYKL